MSLKIEMQVIKEFMVKKIEDSVKTVRMIFGMPFVWLGLLFIYISNVVSGIKYHHLMDDEYYDEEKENKELAYRKRLHKEIAEQLK